jgi:hypothetical protein
MVASSPHTGEGLAGRLRHIVRHSRRGGAVPGHHIVPRRTRSDHSGIGSVRGWTVTHGLVMAVVRSGARDAPAGGAGTLTGRDDDRNCSVWRSKAP